MSEEQFTSTLREMKNRKPFLPFVMELQDGRKVVIQQPFLVFGGGVAGYISETEGLMDFSCDEVRAISLPVTETMP